MHEFYSKKPSAPTASRTFFLRCKEFYVSDTTHSPDREGYLQKQIHNYTTSTIHYIFYASVWGTYGVTSSPENKNTTEAIIPSLERKMFNSFHYTSQCQIYDRNSKPLADWLIPRRGLCGVRTVSLACHRDGAWDSAQLVSWHIFYKHPKMPTNGSSNLSTPRVMFIANL